MSLTSGEKLGPYEILAPIGAGGMGEVYKAKDTRLDRTVAIKVLPSHLADNAQRRERFEREARAVSGLNHPHICTLHDVGSQDGVDFLVMEYLEGETLADRLKRGALPLDQTLRHAAAIADALDKAHRQGVVHRDLKPGNIMLTKSGAKLLDFGLAKLAGADAGASDSALPTEARSLTAQGSIIGTFQYMAPEQLEGKEADSRTDIFAFGAVLYEMTTGKRAFEGKSQASLITAIMGKEPPPISTVEPMSPPALDHVIQRCLVKEPDGRWQSAADLKSELSWIAEAGSDAGVPMKVGTTRRSRERLAWLGMMAFVLSTLVLALILVLEAPLELQPVRFSVLPPPNVASFSNVQFAVSPNGGSLAFVGLMVDGGRLLGIRSFDALEPQMLPGTDGANFPFWSPDNQFIGYFADGKLKKVRASGGPSETLCDVPAMSGGSWNRDDVIVFGSNEGIFRVAAFGGSPAPVTSLDQARQETAHEHPQFLPNGHHFLFLARSPLDEDRGIYAGSLDSPETKRLLSTHLNARYAPPGYLLFMNQGELSARPFDPDALEVSETRFPVARQVRDNISNGRGGFSVSENGVLAYHSVGGYSSAEGSLVWISRDGREVEPIINEPIDYPRYLRLSPDGRRLALTTGSPNEGDLWLYPLDGRPPTPLTYESHNDFPVWSPDGTRVAFRSNREGIPKLFWMPADGSTLEPEPLPTNLSAPLPGSWSPDGRELILWGRRPDTGGDIFALPIDGEQEPQVVVGTEYNERLPRLSPDGNWLAYASNVTGRGEIWVRPYPGPGAPIRLTSNGGTQPVWSRDGRELFYLEGGLGTPNARLMGVAIETAPELRFEPPQVLVDGGFVTYSRGSTRGEYDVAPDGRFVMIKSNAAQETEAQPRPDQLTVVVNWFPTDN